MEDSPTKISTPLSDQRLRFIINPIAGFRRSKSNIIGAIHEIFHDFDFDIVTTTRPGHGTSLAQEAAARNYDVVVAVGGDGTVNEVASGLVHSSTALGIIPRGSGNGLARALGVALQPRTALQALLHGTARMLDVGCAAHRYFFAVSGVGFDARVGKQFNAATWRGPLPYFFIAAHEFFSYRPECFTVNIDNQAEELAPFLLTIANTQQFGNGAIIAPQAQPDDGVLDLCVVDTLTLPRAVRYLPKLFNGTIDHTPIINYRPVQQLAIEKSGTILFHVDGEPVTCVDQLKIAILPRALKVVSPPAPAPLPQPAHAR